MVVNDNGETSNNGSSTVEDGLFCDAVVNPVETEDVITEDVITTPTHRRCRPLPKKWLFLAALVVVAIAVSVSVVSSTGEGDKKTTLPDSDAEPSMPDSEMTSTPPTDQEQEDAPAIKQWLEWGQPLQQDDWYDISLALSQDGSILAVASRQHEVVWLYRNHENDWQAMGNPLEGSDKSFGVRLALSADGYTVAVGGHLRSVGSSPQSRHVGHVQVYEWSENLQDWRKLGTEILGESAFEQSGIAVDLSASGRIVATGAHLHSEQGKRAGRVRVFRYDDATQEWTQMGKDLIGDGAGDQFGGSVALANSGLSIVIGARFHDSDAVEDENDNIGHVRLYTWDNSEEEWKQRGGDLDGEEQNEEFGYSVAISGDGNTVAVGNALNAVTVFRWIPADQLWNEMNIGDAAAIGLDPDPSSNGIFLEVSLSTDGDTMVVLEKPRSQLPSRISVFVYDDAEKKWKQGGPIWTGVVVALSGEGTVLAIGDVEGDGSTTETVRILREGSD